MKLVLESCDAKKTKLIYDRQWFKLAVHFHDWFIDAGRKSKVVTSCKSRDCV